MSKTFAGLSILLAGLIVTGLAPHLSAGSIACVILLMAGGIVLCHELSALNEVDAMRKRRSARVVGHGRMIPPRAGEPWGYAGGLERRADSIELRPGDSVEQIARTMVTTSFRQASQKYHSDRAGANDLPVRIVSARNLLLTAFRRY